MNRRAFLKVSSSLLLAACARMENFDMSTNGQLLARALRGERLLESEIQQLERAMDGFDVSKTFTDNLQNGSGKLVMNEIEAASGFFRTSPINGSWFGWDKYGAGGFPQNMGGSNVLTTITAYPYNEYHNASFIRPYSAVSGAFEISPVINMQGQGVVLSLIGNVQFSSVSHTAYLFAYLYSKTTGAELDYDVAFKDVTGSDIGGADHPFIYNIPFKMIPADLFDVYILFKAKATLPSGAGSIGVDFSAIKVV